MRQSHSWSRLLGFQSEKHRFESRNWSIFCLNINPFLKYFLHRGGLHRYSNFVYLRLNLSKIARKNFKNTGKYPEQWCKPLVQSDCITRSYYETGIQSQYKCQFWCSCDRLELNGHLILDQKGIVVQINLSVPKVLTTGTRRNQTIRTTVKKE